MISYNKQILCCWYTVCIKTLELQWLELKQELYQSFDQLWCFSPKKASEPNQAQEGGVSILKNWDKKCWEESRSLLLLGLYWMISKLRSS